MKKSIIVICVFLVSACSFDRREISKEIETQIQKNNSEKIDLSQIGGAAWQRVCILGPYSDNNKAEKTLGFKWDLEQKTAILSSDSANVLVFVEGKQAISHVEHPRNLGDFAKLSGQCFDRVNATLVRDRTTKDNDVSFVAKK